MGFQLWYENDAGDLEELQGARFADVEAGQSAELGEADTWGLRIDDPASAIYITGYRRLQLRETSAGSNTLVASGRIMARTVKRGDSVRPSLRLGTDRMWDCDVVDENQALGIRIHHGTLANRPAETAGERLRWLLDTGVMNQVQDLNGYVTYPTYRMEAADYTGQTAKDVLADCALEGGYNYFALRLGITAVMDLFFMLPTSSSWASTISISNDPADVDDVTCFEPFYDVEDRITPERIAAGVFLPYSGGSDNSFVYVFDATTSATYAYVDKSAPLANVKTSAKATLIANRLLADSDEEDERLTLRIRVPAAQVNDLRVWHRVDVKLTHAPGFTAFRTCRVLHRAVAQEASGTHYVLSMELTPVEGPQSPAWTCPLDAGITATPSGFYGPLGGTTTDSTGNIWYANSNLSWFTDDTGYDYPDGPRPSNSFVRGLGFAAYGVPGGDGGGPGVASVIGFVFAGEGTIDWETTYYLGNGTEWTLTQVYMRASGTTIEQTDTASANDSGSMVVGPLPEDATSCYRMFIMKIEGRTPPDIGTSYGVFPGLTWTPA